MGNQKTSYQLIAITIGLILFAGSFSGSASIAFADDVNFGEIKAKAQKAKKDKKCKEEKKYEGICDEKDPKIKITSPMKNEEVAGPTITVTGTATDKGSGIDKVEVRLDKGAFMPAVVAPDGSWSIDFGTVEEPVSDGKHKVTAKATDKVDNDKRKSVKFKVI